MLAAILLWWWALSLIGWLLWPLIALVLPQAHARGWAHARAAGLLIVSYTYWFGGYVGLDLSGVRILGAAIILLCVASMVVGWVERDTLVAVLADEWRAILASELLCLAAFVLYALFRSCDARIDHTEEPMDFAFLNGILRSVAMPPRDPWLSGHGISYYYLGHLMVAVVAKITKTVPGVAYNLGLAQTFALAVLGAFGVLLDLAPWKAGIQRWRVIGWALVGALFLMVAGNLEGVVELARARGLGSVAAYHWLDIAGLEPPSGPVAWLPEGHWWWWRASRIIQDHNILGKMTTVITEFPAFSFILGDLHAHVLSLPLNMVAIALVLQLCRDSLGRAGGRWWRPRHLAAALLFGALGFANSWDLATMAALLIVALWAVQGRARTKGWGKQALVAVSFATIFLISSIIPYLPFYRDLTSQVQGIGVLYWTKTTFKHMMLCLGMWLLPVAADLLLTRKRAWRALDRRGRTWMIALGVVLLVAPWIGTLVMGGWGRFLLGIVTLVTTGPWTVALILVMLGLAGLRLVSGAREAVDGDLATRGASMGMVFIGLGLVYGAEFFYVRDMFDTRMNTVFKLYYQAWILLGMGAWVAIGRLWRRSGWGRLVSGACVAVLVMACWYSGAAGYTRAMRHKGERTLNGTAYLESISPCEYEAIEWLRERATPRDVLIEAPGREFDASTSRLSAWTGVSTVIGWPGHEAQWRGQDTEVQQRIVDVDTLYGSRDAAQVHDLLTQYWVTTLYVGAREIERYELDASDLAWYGSFLDEAFVCDGVRLFSVRGQGK